ncbi:translocation/assembly module TamB domain-containing protein [Chitinophaga vietnamensis]|uniref:translocation/assembly module TamB domain-containing protein n=1 Tax=Chitinophaga vietnamensis TaxID=2593957 RepID=UPI0011774F85|nr:translocation/assembly module TamB domain-containing protein [Chitinophaga vietnamensis]
MTEPAETGKKHGRPWWRWLLWILVAVLLLPVMLLLLLQLNGVQNYLRQQGESYLQKKLNTRVQIGYLRARGWQYLELRNVFVADTTNHALFYTGSLKVHYNLFSLLGNELKIDKLEWDTALINVYRLNDSTFNYQFAVDAFVTPKAAPDTFPKATGTTLQFILKDISLKKFSVRYEDLPGGMNAVLTWNELHLDPDDLLVNDGVYSFRGIRLDGLKGFFRQNYIPKSTNAAPPPPPADTNSAALHLLLKKLSITNSTFLYSGDGIGITTAWKIGELKVLNSSLDQDSTRIQIGDLAINNTAGIVAMLPGKDTTPATPDTTPNTWQLFATRVDLNKLALSYDNGGPAPKAAGPDPDYKHLLLTNLNSHVANIRYLPDSISASMKTFTMRDWSGFTIRKANMDLVFTPKSLLLKNLLVQTNKSILRKNIAVTVPSWSAISKNLDQMNLEGNLDSIHVALGEWLGFVPDARKNKYLAPLWDKQLTATAIFKGSLAQLGIKELYINDQQGNVIKADNSVISHAADPGKFNADIPNLFIQSGNKALRAWLPPGAMPDTPRLPENMLITGSFNGGMKNITTQLQLKSDYASANINAKLVNITDSIHSSYDISIPYFRANPGVLMYDTTLGWVSGSLKANGQGYTMKGMAAQAAVQLSEATYNGYTYNGVNVDANINKGAFRAAGQSSDSSLHTIFDISGTLGDTSLESLKANIDITKADLYATHWYTEPLSVSGLLNADFSSLEPQRIEGSALLTNWQIATKGHVAPLDTVSLLATYTYQQMLELKSPLGPINAYGHLDYTKIGAALSQIISKPLLPRDSGRIIEPPHGQLLTWDASLIWPRSLQPLFPALRVDKPLVITGRLNSDSSLFVMQAFAPKLAYDSLKIDSLGLSAHILDTSLQANVALAHMAHPTFPLHHTQVSSHANAGVVNFDLLLDDASYRAKYKLGGMLTFLPANVMELSLKPGLLLNKQEWVVDRNNLLRMKNGLPDTANIRLSQGSQSLQLATKPDSSTTPALQLNVANFKLSTITGLLATDTLLANGNLNAEATVRNWDKSPLINATLKLDSLTVKNTLMGTVDASVENTQPNQYSLQASLSGNENDLKINGTYDSTINATVNINHLNMSALEPFTMGNLTRMYGSTDGKFTINGDTKTLEILGNLHFNNAGGTISMIGANLHLPDENILIDEKGIAMNNVVIADSLGNEMVVNGRINTPDFTKYNFNLDVNADNFMVLGAQQNEDQWIYGPAFIDSKVKIRGSMDMPRIDATVKLRDKSKVTLTIPQEAPGLADREGVVEFVDKSRPVDSALIAKMDSLKYQNPKLKGINFSGNMEITPESLIKIIIDKQNGDYVEAKGTANINATLDASSKMSLTGRYEINEGKYEMSLNQLIKRSFDIQKGSYISFNGDAMNADLDITAKYTVYAPAIDLVSDGLADVNDASVRNTYKQRLPFEVYLMIKGNMMKPDISFSLDMPEKERNVLKGAPYNKLKQLNQVPSEVNKQVMGLLVLGTFIPDDPTSTLDNSAAGGVAQAARNSVSKILSQQLNNLAGNLIKGVDLNFDLQSQQDYSTGSAQEQTKLNIGASKTLFNDRLTVSVGSNIMLAGSQQAQNASSIVGDVSIDYKLTRDGRYKVRVYRNNNQSVIEGQIVESGVAFMLVMDYDEFREILQRAKRSTSATKLRESDKKKNKK